MSSQSQYPDSYYAATAEMEEFPVMDGDERCDVCVIGGGFTGLSTAIDLAAAGLDVVLIEAGKIGWGASGRSGGQIIRGYNKDPETLASMVGRDNAQTLWDLAGEAIDLIEERCDTHKIDPGLRYGWIEIALKERDAKSGCEEVEVWKKFGYDKAQWLDRDEVQNEFLNTPNQYGAFYDPGSGQLHPMRYVMGLARAAREGGVKIYTGTKALDITGDTPVTCKTDNGTITADKLVLAGNAYLGRLSPKLSRRIMPAHTYMIATEPLPEDVIKSIFVQDVAVCDSHFILNYFRRSDDNRVLYGGLVSYSGMEYGIFKNFLHKSMADYFPQLEDVKTDYFWSGCVGATLNRLPQVGKLGDNTYYAHGFSGHGVALTGMAGRLVAEAITGKPDRFNTFASMPAYPYPGGTLLRKPLFIMGRAWLRLRDKF